MNLAQFAIPMACEVPVGAFAVWQIPELGVSVPLYKGQGAVAQKQVDAENSASYMPYGCGHIIADHAEDAEINGSRNHNPIVMLIIVFVPVMQLYPAQRGYEYRQRKIPA